MFLRIVSCSLALWALLSLALPLPASAIPKSMEELSRITDKLLQTSVTYGAIPSLFRPKFGRIMDADLAMESAEPVFIVVFPDGPRAYPQRIMAWHMVVNEVVRDVGYAVTYCPITGSVAAYKSQMEGTNLIFDAEGRLYDGNAVLIDRNTGSLWLQLLGMAFEGPLTGRGMPMLPVFWTTWGAVKRVYPDIPVLTAPAGSRRPYARDPYGNYLKTDTYYDNDTLIYPVRYSDQRLPRKAQILGLEHRGMLLAIDVAYVRKKGTVNFFLGDTPLLAVHDKRLDVVRVYNRHIWDKPSLFVYDNGLLVDIATRTRWDPSTGKALEGNLKGASMQQLYGMYSMWFAWFDINPETYLIPGPGEVPADVLHLTPLDQKGKDKP